jgi:hypothetical protein
MQSHAGMATRTRMLLLTRCSELTEAGAPAEERFQKKMRVWS